ncbi:MAG: hypothetical protein INR73_00010 [Williamsia sp.]|nr:hypothetical protein [Williamsia sp.]
MSPIPWPGKNNWTSTQKIVFRFVFIYFVLYCAPWTWLAYIPGGDLITGPYDKLEDWAVHAANRLFRQYKELVSPNGSGDTSYNWVQVELYLLLSVLGCVIWSLLDRKWVQYNRLAYWFRLTIRYWIIITCFAYGIIKLFFLQMPFPNLSQLATPLGDYAPMRLSWMFLGYSQTYQFFSGAAEFLAGALLLFRRTATLGALLAAGVFANVMIMNLSYDIPVKLFSTHLFVASLLLLAFEYKRIAGFLLLNRPTGPSHLYQVRFPKKWMRVTRVVLKCLFVAVVVVMPFVINYNRYVQVNNPRDIKPIRSGIYNVAIFVRNQDTIPPLITDSTRWQDVIFEKGGSGSIATTDTTFWQRYRRGYFTYSTDTLKQEIEFKKSNMQRESILLFRLRYELPDSNTIRLRGTIGKNTLYAELRKSSRYFQLPERQFHWLSEYNR